MKELAIELNRLLRSRCFWLIMGVMYLLLFLMPVVALAAPKVHPEAWYQERWCKKQGGVTEFHLLDRTRVDCLLDGYAVEVDFAGKWAEAIGQSLYYASQTQREPGVVLILESLDDLRYVERIQAVDRGIRLWYVHP